MYEWVTGSVVMDENEYGSNFFCVARSDELVFIDTGMLNARAPVYRGKSAGFSPQSRLKLPL